MAGAVSEPAITLGQPEIDIIRRAHGARGWRWWTGAEDLNVFGLRASGALVDSYNDAVGWIATDTTTGTQRGRLYRATTKPGRRALIENKASGGVFVLADGMYHRGLWTPGLHHGRPGLVQAPGAIAEGWRDNDGDGLIDPDTRKLVPGRGINCHDPGVRDPAHVGNSSEGCICPWRAEYVGELRDAVARQAAAGHGDVVSFGLHRATTPQLRELLARVASA